MKTVNNLSPLRYPGSKQKIVNHFEKILGFNSISPEIIVEPFVGGGNVFLHFLINKYSEKAIISDKDKMIYCFWKILFKNPDCLLNFIEKVKIEIDTFNYFKNISENSESATEEDLAMACLFLNRTSFSGILVKSTGPIGGKQQSSPYKIGCRFNRENLIEKLEYISTLSDRVTVFNSNWNNTIKYVKNTICSSKEKKEIFYYLDPPFYHKGKELYRSFFSLEEHEKLCKFLLKFDETSWILSYDNADEIKALYKNHMKHVHIKVPYSVNSYSRRIAKEIIITPLKIPKY